MKVMELLTAAVEQEAADIFLIPGRPFSYKIGGRIICEGTEKIMPDEMDDMIRQIYELAGGRSEERVLNEGDDDFFLCSTGGIAFPRQYFPSERFSGRRYPCCAI